MQDLSQLSLEQLQQLRQENEKNIESWQAWLSKREMFLQAYYRGEAGIGNLQEYLAETQRGREKIEQWQKEIQEIDLLIAQYQNSTNKPSNEDSKEKLTLAQKAKLEALKNALLSAPPYKTQSTQKVLKSIESLQSFLKQDFLTRQYL